MTTSSHPFTFSTLWCCGPMLEQNINNCCHLCSITTSLNEHREVSGYFVSILQKHHLKQIQPPAPSWTENTSWFWGYQIFSYEDALQSCLMGSGLKPLKHHALGKDFISDFHLWSISDFTPPCPRPSTKTSFVEFYNIRFMHYAWLFSSHFTKASCLSSVSLSCYFGFLC